MVTSDKTKYPHLTKMATPVIKLEPVRMGSISSPSSTVAAQKYVPPNMRTGSTLQAESTPVKIDLGINQFPTLGSAPKKAASWGKHAIKTALETVVETPSAVAEESPSPQNMKDKIKEQIRQAELKEEQKLKPKEEDPYKMTREELIEAGWSILSLKATEVKESVFRLNTLMTTASLTSEDYYE